MSGGVDFRPFPNGWQIKDMLDDENTHRKNWDEHVVINQMDLLKKDHLTLIMDCGTEDMFLKGNRELHNKLVEEKIAHDYIERPGGHTWDYWRNSIKYQALFFHELFQRSDKSKTAH